MPASKTVKVEVWEDGRFVGAIVFARGANQRLGRRSVGVDLSAHYLDQAVRRISDVPLPLGA